MAKSLILSNGNIFVGLDTRGFVSDFFFPYVGSENHVRGESHRIGVWQHGRLSWLDSDEWSVEIDLDKDTFVGTMKCFNTTTNLELLFKNVVYNEKNIFIREVEMINHGEHTEEVKLFFHQVFSIYGTLQQDTAYYDPIKNALIHYEGRRMFFIYAEMSDVPFGDYCVGLAGIEGKEGTWKDAEDGHLSKNPIEHGHVDSTLSLSCTLHKGERKKLYYWITVGETKAEVYELHDYIQYKTPQHLVESTTKYWKAWLDRQDYLRCDMTEDRQTTLFKKSLFYIRGNIDNRGAIIASGDSDMLKHGRDTYSYVWPRDGALTVMTLLMVGEYNISKHFFKFCNDVVEQEGYLMHKYRADKSLGSSWHPFVRDGSPSLPIQEDETALVLSALWEYYEKTKDIEFIESHYNTVIKPMATFLAEFIDKETGLPLPSYDLWEEKHGVSTYTAATVYAGLLAGAKFAKLFEKENDETLFKDTAERMRHAILIHLYDKDLKMFVKLINKKEGHVEYDRTLDMSSIHAIYTYGVLAIDDPIVEESIKTIEEKLRIHTGIDGVPRYQGDHYYMQVEGIPNPWYITTLWLAQYYAQTARNAEALEIVKYWLNWTVVHSPQSGVLSEQLHPFTGEQISANPLTWSHAEYVRTFMYYHQALERLGLCKVFPPSQP
jgi:GH15 family glucan-1,4-alpha-glucosidase